MIHEYLRRPDTNELFTPAAGRREPHWWLLKHMVSLRYHGGGGSGGVVVAFPGVFGGVWAAGDYGRHGRVCEFFIYLFTYS